MSWGSAAAASELQDPASARQRLHASREEQRGWEWHHLTSRLDSAELVICFPAPALDTRVDDALRREGYARERITAELGKRLAQHWTVAFPAGGDHG